MSYLSLWTQLNFQFGVERNFGQLKLKKYYDAPTLKLAPTRIALAIARQRPNAKEKVLALQKLHLHCSSAVSAMLSFR
eukprot:2801374-Amphidinium_carterae.1